MVRRNCLVCLLSAGLAANSLPAATYAWTDWTSASTGAPGSADGILSAGGSTVSVNYTGEVYFAQITGGTNYWNPPTPYVSAMVSNAPPASDIIAIRGGNSIVNRITFSAPVLNPVMAIVSLGQPGVVVQYRFDHPITLLSNAAGYWGTGPLTVVGGNWLEGREGHGAIQFSGAVSSISWTVPNFENWHGFTVGVEGLASDNTGIPEPGTALLGGAGLLLLGLARWRRC